VAKRRENGFSNILSILTFTFFFVLNRQNDDKRAELNTIEKGKLTDGAHAHETSTRTNKERHCARG
jgi:hypothetical protein